MTDVMVDAMLRADDLTPTFQEGLHDTAPDSPGTPSRRRCSDQPVAVDVGVTDRSRRAASTKLFHTSTSS